MTFPHPSSPALRRAALLVLAGAIAGAGLAASVAGSGSTRASAAADSVIVRARPGSEAGAEALARRLGGSVRARLQIIGGFSATLPANALGALRSSSAVLSITPNTRLAPQSSSYSADYDPASDIYSMASITQLTGARSWWRAGYTGAGVDVAMVDSGVAPVEGLDGAGKIVDGPDLSLESQAPNLRNLDTYGHGTFMAGLIAGRGGEPSSDAPAATYLGWRRTRASSRSKWRRPTAARTSPR